RPRTARRDHRRVAGRQAKGRSGGGSRGQDRRLFPRLYGLGGAGHRLSRRSSRLACPRQPAAAVRRLCGHVSRLYRGDLAGDGRDPVDGEVAFGRGPLCGRLLRFRRRDLPDRIRIGFRAAVERAAALYGLRQIARRTMDDGVAGGGKPAPPAHPSALPRRRPGDGPGAIHRLGREARCLGASMIGRAFLATFRAILTDSTALMLLIGSAILYSFFYPSAYSGEVPTRIPIAVVDMDHSGASRSLTGKLAASQQAEVVARPPSTDDALRWIERRSASAIVFIPEGFERDILRGEQGTVALYGNGAYLLRSSTALAGVGAALGDLARDAAADQAMALGAPAPPALGMIQRPLFNTREGYGSAIFPGVTFVIIHQTLLMGLAMLAATMRERRGPLAFSPRELLGIALAFFVIGCANVVYFTGFVFWFQDMPRAAGGLGALAVAGSLFVAATVAGALALA